MFTRKQLIALTFILIILVLCLSIYFIMLKHKFSSSSAYDYDGQISDKIPCYIYGGVKNPGLYYLDKGSTRGVAIEKAGGLLHSGLMSKDDYSKGIGQGEIIYVPDVKGDLNNKKFNRSSSVINNSTSEFIKSVNVIQQNQSGKIDLNRLNLNVATYDDLLEIPEISEDMANGIIKLRDERGKFENPEEILKVPGITEELYFRIKDKICL